MGLCDALTNLLCCRRKRQSPVLEFKTGIPHHLPTVFGYKSPKLVNVTVLSKRYSNSDGVLCHQVTFSLASAKDHREDLDLN